MMINDFLYNQHIIALNNLRLEYILGDILRDFLFHTQIRWGSLSKITSEYTNSDEYSVEAYINIFKHYQRIVERVASDDSLDDQHTSQLNKATCFDSSEFDSSKNIYNKVAYYINMPQIQTMEDIDALANEQPLLPKEKNGTNILKAIVLFSLFVNVHKAQILVLNKPSSGSTKYPAHFLLRICQTFDDPEFFLLFVSLLFNYFNKYLNRRKKSIHLIKHSVSEDKYNLNELIKFIESFKSESMDILLFQPEINEATMLIENAFINKLKKVIIPFSNFIVNDYVNTTYPTDSETSILNIDNDTRKSYIKNSKITIVVHYYTKKTLKWPSVLQTYFLHL